MDGIRISLNYNQGRMQGFRNTEAQKLSLLREFGVMLPVFECV